MSISNMEAVSPITGNRQRALLRVLAWVAFFTAAQCGCTTVTQYQSPVTKFQLAVNSANDSIRPYLLSLNTLIAKANLYGKLRTGKPWGADDFSATIPPDEINLRLQALSTIASYANALGAVVTSGDDASLGQATETLCDHVASLHSTIESLGRTSNSTRESSSQLDLRKPVESLVSLFGKMAIERMQRQAIEKAIIDGAKPIGNVIESLRVDLRKLSDLHQTEYDTITGVLMWNYQMTREKADPKDLLALTDRFISDYQQIHASMALRADVLLGDMSNAHKALVAFARSEKLPKDLAGLSVQMDIFSAHAKSFNAAIESVQSATKPLP